MVMQWDKGGRIAIRRWLCRVSEVHQGLTSHPRRKIVQWRNFVETDFARIQSLREEDADAALLFMCYHHGREARILRRRVHANPAWVSGAGSGLIGADSTVR